MIRGMAGKFFGVRFGEGATSMDIIIAIGFYLFAAAVAFALDTAFRAVGRKIRNGKK